jgi:hypothetical protein
MAPMGFEESFPFRDSQIMNPSTQGHTMALFCATGKNLFIHSDLHLVALYRLVNYLQRGHKLLTGKYNKKFICKMYD